MTIIVFVLVCVWVDRLEVSWVAILSCQVCIRFFIFWTWLRKAWETSSLTSLSITNADDEGYSSCTGIVRGSWHHTSQYLGCTTVSLYIGIMATLMIVYRRYYRSVLVRIGGIECDHQRIGESVACKLIRAGWRDLLDRSTQAMPVEWLDCGSVTFCYPSETIERFITPLLALNDLILSTQRISDISTLFLAIIWTYVLSWKNLFGGKLLPYTWVKSIRMIVDRMKGAFTQRTSISSGSRSSGRNLDIYVTISSFIVLWWNRGFCKLTTGD